MKRVAILLVALLGVAACGDDERAAPREELLIGCAVDGEHALLAFDRVLAFDGVEGGGHTTRLYATSLGSEGWTDLRRVPVPAEIGPSSFGSSIAISGRVAAIAAPKEGEGRHTYAYGAVYIYLRKGDAWEAVQRLSRGNRRSPPRRPAAQNFGTRVVMHGGWLAVGGHGWSEHGTRGTTFLYRLQGDRWQFHREISTEKKYGGGEFPAMSERRLLVGARVFVRDRESWAEEGTLPGPWAIVQAVAITDEYAIVLGARELNDKGKTFVFTRHGSDWAPDTANSDHLGVCAQGRVLRDPGHVVLSRSGNSGRRRLRALSESHAVVEHHDSGRHHSLQFYERVEGSRVWRKQGEPFLPPVLKDEP